MKFLVSVFLLLHISCTTNLNQYKNDAKNINKRHGKWREVYSADEGTLTAVGHYDMGEKVGNWKMKLNNQLYQIDKIRKNITYTKMYYPNGKKKVVGKSRLDISDKQRHWFYVEDWKYYDMQGNLIYIKNYHDGTKIDSIAF